MMARTAPPRDSLIRHLLSANEVAREAVTHGHHPFGAILVAPDGETVLMRQGNLSTVEHAESVLMQRAARAYSEAFLWDCTMVSNVESCAMCATTAYWANVGCVVFGLTEARLLEITGNHPENPTMSVGSDYIFAHGQKPILLIGPVVEVEAAVAELQSEFWKNR